MRKRAILMGGIIVPLILFSAIHAPGAQWAWGEVVSADAQNNMLTVKYLDQQSGEEREIAAAVDEKTIYTNAAGLGEIKAGDTISMDYAVGPDAKNIALNIVVEKPKPPQQEPA
ncbi:MAG: hypothetical protein Q8N85_05765, partial [Candidatus Omnitrophota bacterium]|nr:hypothetical protein [Candidatus Omnitrophota bacterium]